MHFFFIQRVIHPFTFFSPVYHLTTAKAFHMMGKCRLCNIELFQNHTGAKLTKRKHIHNHKPIRVGQHFEKLCILPVLFVHFITSHRLVSILYTIHRRMSMYCVPIPINVSSPHKNLSCGLDDFSESSTVYYAVWINFTI